MAIKTKAGQGQALFATELDNNFSSLHEMVRGTGAPVKVALDSVTPDWGWRDLIGSVRTDLATTQATPATYIGGIRQPLFSIGNEEVREFHLPHDYIPGTNLFIHAHWSHNSTLVTSGSVTWQFEMMSAKGHNTDTFYTPVIINTAQAASTERYRHMIAESQCSEPAGVSMLDTDWIDVDGLIVVVCRLTANTMTGTAKPFLHSFDIHYQSSNRATKNKAPNFYA